MGLNVIMRPPRGACYDFFKSLDYGLLKNHFRVVEGLKKNGRNIGAHTFQVCIQIFMAACIVFCQNTISNTQNSDLFPLVKFPVS
jgi:hypothetical protein